MKKMNHFSIYWLAAVVMLLHTAVSAQDVPVGAASPNYAPRMLPGIPKAKPKAAPVSSSRPNLATVPPVDLDIPPAAMNEQARILTIIRSPQSERQMRSQAEAKALATPPIRATQSPVRDGEIRILTPEQAAQLKQKQE